MQTILTLRPLVPSHSRNPSRRSKRCSWSTRPSRSTRSRSPRTQSTPRRSPSRHQLRSHRRKRRAIHYPRPRSRSHRSHKPPLSRVPTIRNTLEDINPLHQRPADLPGGRLSHRSVIRQSKSSPRQSQRSSSNPRKLQQCTTIKSRSHPNISTQVVRPICRQPIITHPPNHQPATYNQDQPTQKAISLSSLGISITHAHQEFREMILILSTPIPAFSR
jgi:hypothetical protein